MKKRIELLKAMHVIITNMNDENAYWHWVTMAVPDCPDDEDFEFIAEDDEEFKECMEYFMKTYKNYSYAGIYCDNVSANID